jgi:serine/alanine adding enzyme
MDDIYFETNYGKLYEKVENGKTEVFKFETDFGIVQHMFIKRIIDTQIDDIAWYDIITPYGYGGPIIKRCEAGRENELVNEFGHAFAQYCKENNIVSEFIRFHPVIKNSELFKDIYDVIYMRNTVGTNLEDFDDPIQSEFSKSCRKKIRRALREGVKFEVIENPDNFDTFKRIYYSTMDRNKASDYYYFDDDYFNSCLELLGEHIISTKAYYKGETIAEGFYFKYKNIIHIHLSGTLNDYLYLSPAYVLRYAITSWGKENGYKLIHHGGGTTNSETDSLYQFKKQFGKNTEFKFYVGRKIWNEEIYNKLCKLKGVNKEDVFFPAYRKS